MKRDLNNIEFDFNNEVNIILLYKQAIWHLFSHKMQLIFNKVKKLLSAVILILIY